MSQGREKLIVGVTILVFLFLLTFPFLFAQNSSDATLVFGGFLINPVDGNSYLAKMRQGFEGSWLFTLPYTADPGTPALINPYYLLLGHIARWLGTSLIFTYHAARIIGATFLAVSLYNFFQRVFEGAGKRIFALALALIGSGLGWLAIFFGYITSDFWVAEAFPFLASFVNPHFPLGIAIQIWLLTPFASGEIFSRSKSVLNIFASLIMSLVYPFGVAVTLAILGAWAIWSFVQKLSWRREFTHLICVAFGGVPYILYSLWITNTHPVLTIWNAQNITPSPTPLNLFISLSPAIILAAWAIWFSIHSRDESLQYLVLWLIIGILILYIPVNIQRRLSSALYVPVSSLAIITVYHLKLRKAQRWVLACSLILMALPTTALILLGSMNASRNLDTDLFIYRDELSAFNWIDANTPTDAIVLTSPHTGNLIPAYSYAKVLYGHPFETINAGERETLMTSFFSGSLSSERVSSLLAFEGVDYIFYGPREILFGPLPRLNGWQIAYQRGQVQIWEKIQ